MNSLDQILITSLNWEKMIKNFNKMIIKYIGFIYSSLSYSFIKTQSLLRIGLLITLFVSNISWLTFAAFMVLNFEFCFFNRNRFYYCACSTLGG